MFEYRFQIYGDVNRFTSPVLKDSILCTFFFAFLKYLMSESPLLSTKLKTIFCHLTRETSFHSSYLQLVTLKKEKNHQISPTHGSHIDYMWFQNEFSEIGLLPLSQWWAHWWLPRITLHFSQRVVQRHAGAYCLRSPGINDGWLAKSNGVSWFFQDHWVVPWSPLFL